MAAARSGGSNDNSKREPPTSENPRRRGGAVEGRQCEGKRREEGPWRSHQATTLMLPCATARALGGHSKQTELARGGSTAALQFERSGERLRQWCPDVCSAKEDFWTANGCADERLRWQCGRVEWTTVVVSNAAWRRKRREERKKKEARRKIEKMRGNPSWEKGLYYIGFMEKPM